MSAVRKRWVILRHPDAEIRFGKGVYVGPRFSLYVPHGGTFIAHDGAEFRRDFRAEIFGDGRIEIGKDSVCTYHVLLQCSTSVVIGERCMLAQSALVVDGQHRFRDLSQPMLHQGFDFKPVAIGDDVWLGAKTTVMANVGTRTVVGAGAVVNRDAPAYSVVVGVPARAIEDYGPP